MGYNELINLNDLDSIKLSSHKFRDGVYRLKSRAIKSYSTAKENDKKNVRPHYKM